MIIPKEIPIYGDLSYRGKSPSETSETVTFFNYIRRLYPDSYGLIAYHPRNEGKRTVNQITREKSEGLVTGTCDIIIVGCPSLCVEMKRKNHTKSIITQEQIKYLSAAKNNNSFVCIALGHEAAIEAFNDWRALNKC